MQSNYEISFHHDAEENPQLESLGEEKIKIKLVTLHYFTLKPKICKISQCLEERIRVTPGTREAKIINPTRVKTAQSKSVPKKCREFPQQFQI